MMKRVPPKTLELRRAAGIVPRGAMREIMEMMHRTAMGVDQDYENITKQISRTALADGWGGSMVSTDISDILFGTPSPVEVEVDMGVLEEDQVDIIVHGHEPNLLESMVASVADPTLIEAAKMRELKELIWSECVAREALRRCLDVACPMQEIFPVLRLCLVTGAIDAMTVDIQCIKQDLKRVADFYDTPFITTNYRAKIEGARHIQLEEHDPRECTDEIVIKAITRFKNRKKPIPTFEEIREGEYTVFLSNTLII